MYNAIFAFIVDLGVLTWLAIWMISRNKTEVKPSALLLALVLLYILYLSIEVLSVMRRAPFEELEELLFPQGLSPIVANPQNFSGDNNNNYVPHLPIYQNPPQQNRQGQNGSQAVKGDEDYPVL